VHHLAVDIELQERAIGASLMRELDVRFRAMGVVKVSLWIESGNRKVIDFYRHVGYDLRDLVTMSKALR
jgi:ribosomal protein S18 acetylase RimI-like enzyme